MRGERSQSQFRVKGQVHLARPQASVRHGYATELSVSLWRNYDLEFALNIVGLCEELCPFGTEGCEPEFDIALEGMRGGPTLARLSVAKPYEVSAFVHRQVRPPTIESNALPGSTAAAVGRNHQRVLTV